MSIRVPSYLYKFRHGVYHFRMAIPRNQRKKVGRTEIRKSLKTRDPRIARELVREEINVCRHIDIESDQIKIRIEYRDDPDNEIEAATKISKALMDSNTLSNQPVTPSKPAIQCKPTGNRINNPRMGQIGRRFYKLIRGYSKVS